MIPQQIWKILTTLQKLPKNVGDLGKLIVAKGIKKLPKVQKIAQSGHTAQYYQFIHYPGHGKSYHWWFSVLAFESNNYKYLVPLYFYQWSIPGLFFFTFVFSKVNSKHLPMTGFEQGTCGVWSTCSANWATTTTISLPLVSNLPLSSIEPS